MPETSMPNAVPFLDLSIDKEEQASLLARIQRVFEHGQFILGPEHRQFEQEMAKKTGRKHALAVGSGTDALYLTFQSLGIGESDEVITTALSWIASTNAFALLGASPVFADINTDLNLNPEAVERLISPSTKAILAVDYAGLPCDYDALTTIAHRHGLHLIEDGSQAFGASYKSEPVGSFGLASCISLNPMKSLAACGEAGVILTDSDSLADAVKVARYNGMRDKETCIQPGINGRMDTLQAAILLERLASMDAKVAQRIANARRYKIELDGLFDLPVWPDHSTHVNFLFLIGHPNRDELKDFMEQRGIEVRIRDNILISEQPAYQHCRSDGLAVSRRLVKQKLALPVSEKLTEHQQRYVVSQLKEFVSQYGTSGDLQ